LITSPKLPDTSVRDCEIKLAHDFFAFGSLEVQPARVGAGLELRRVNLQHFAASGAIGSEAGGYLNALFAVAP
jgi:hypothetical protein